MLGSIQERITLVFKSKEQLEQEANNFEQRSKGAELARNIALTQLAGSHTDQAQAGDVSIYQGVMDKDLAQAARLRRAANMYPLRRLFMK